jgi:hypothetical protein
MSENKVMKSLLEALTGVASEQGFDKIKILSPIQ